MDYITIQDATFLHLHGFEQLTEHVIIQLGKLITLRTANKKDDELLISEYLVDFENGVARHPFLAETILSKNPDGEMYFTFINGVYYELPEAKG